jgi:hypothetical protein
MGCKAHVDIVGRLLVAVECGRAGWLPPAVLAPCKLSLISVLAALNAARGARYETRSGAKRRPKLVLGTLNGYSRQ